MLRVINIPASFSIKNATQLTTFALIMATNPYLCDLDFPAALFEYLSTMMKLEGINIRISRYYKWSIFFPTKLSLK
jgi:hypothetical protein